MGVTRYFFSALFVLSLLSQKQAQAAEITITPAGRGGMVFWLGSSGLANLLAEVKSDGTSFGYISSTDVLTAGMSLPSGVNSFAEMSAETSLAIVSALENGRIPFYTSREGAARRSRPQSLKTVEPIIPNYEIGATSGPAGRNGTIARLKKLKEIYREETGIYETIGWIRTEDLRTGGLLLNSSFSPQEVTQLTTVQILKIEEAINSGRLLVYDSEADAVQNKNGKALGSRCGTALAR